MAENWGGGGGGDCLWIRWKTGPDGNMAIGVRGGGGGTGTVTGTRNENFLSPEEVEREADNVGW